MNRRPAVEAEHVIAVKNELGEGPLWDPREQSLYWVDIQNHRIHRFHPAKDEHKSFGVGRRVTALGLRAVGGLVVTTDKGFAFWNPQTQLLDLIAALEEEIPHTRFNDGAVDRRGRFWAGTMNEAEPAATDGSLYRLEADRTLRRVASGFTICNGLGWSPDNKTLYFTDTLRRVILAYDYDLASGAIANQRPFIRVPEEEGFPDGLTVDIEGFVWSAHWGGWKVTRYDPNGRIDLEVQVPAQNVTSCAFGGENLGHLYITTARLTLSEKERKNQPLAGDLFRIEVGVKGMTEPKFTG